MRNDSEEKVSIVLALLAELRADVERAYKSIRMYRYLLGFSFKQLVKAKCARIVAILVVAATVAHLVAPVTHFPFFPHLPPQVEALLGLILLAFGMIGFLAHSNQTKAIHQYAQLVRHVCTLSSDIVELDFPDSAERQARLNEYLLRILSSFDIAYGQTSEEGFTVYSGILMPQPTGELLRICETPFSAYNQPGILPAGSGAGGRAASTNKTIYVPKVSHRHGFAILEGKGSSPIRDWKLQKNVFEQFGDFQPPFQSLLCVPINICAQRRDYRVRAVLYIGCTAIGALRSDFHLDAAQLEASFIATVFGKFFDETWRSQSSGASSSRAEYDKRLGRPSVFSSAT